MKIKSLPEDFIVEEVYKPSLKKKGAYGIFLLKKYDIDTFDAVALIAKTFNLPRKSISYAGIKDKRGTTTQYISIHSPKEKKIKNNRFTLQYFGRSDQAIQTGDHKGNIFTITLRDLTDKEKESIKENIKHVAKNGFINYFDDQRFGALTRQGFIAIHLFKKEYEQAFKIHMTQLRSKAPKNIRLYRKAMKEHWGNWDKMLQESKKNRSAGSRDNNSLEHLKQNPTDFKTAFAKIDQRKKEMYLAGYQSYVWNETIKELIKEQTKEYREIKYKAGRLFLPKNNITLPITLKTISPKEADPLSESILKKDQLKKEDLKVRDMGHLFFKSIERKIKIIPKDLKIVKETKKELVISFFLEKGAYATMLLKQLSS